MTHTSAQRRPRRAVDGAQEGVSSGIHDDAASIGRAVDGHRRGGARVHRNHQLLLRRTRVRQARRVVRERVTTPHGLPLNERP